MAGESWDKYQKLILHRLDCLSSDQQRLIESVAKISERQGAIERDLEKMKAVASAFGIVGGILVTVVTWIIEYYQRR